MLGSQAVSLIERINIASYSVPFLEDPLLEVRLYTSNVYFLSGDPYHYTGEFGQTDKNHQMIAVTLRLRFAARVN